MRTEQFFSSTAFIPSKPYGKPHRWVSLEVVNRQGNYLPMTLRSAVVHAVEHSETDYDGRKSAGYTLIAHGSVCVEHHSS